MDLLKGLGISWFSHDRNSSVGDGSAVGNFKWTAPLPDGGEVTITEENGTPKLLEWLFGKLEEGLAVDGQVLGIRDVKGKNLAAIKANGKEATGKSDGCIATEADIAHCEKTKSTILVYGMALVKIKTDRTKMNDAQFLLELAALSKHSRWERAYWYGWKCKMAFVTI
jgi:hypothetical protein